MMKNAYPAPTAIDLTTQGFLATAHRDPTDDGSDDDHWEDFEFETDRLWAKRERERLHRRSLRGAFYD